MYQTRCISIYLVFEGSFEDEFHLLSFIWVFKVINPGMNAFNETLSMLNLKMGELCIETNKKRTRALLEIERLKEARKELKDLESNGASGSGAGGSGSAIKGGLGVGIGGKVGKGKGKDGKEAGGKGGVKKNESPSVTDFQLQNLQFDEEEKLTKLTEDFIKQTGFLPRASVATADVR
jgi:hypothetical protein